MRGENYIMDKTNKICIYIASLSLLSSIILGFITYQQQNYIQSLHKIVQSNAIPSKKLLKSKSIESSIDSLESSIFDLEEKISDLDNRVTDLEGGSPATEADYKRWESMGLNTDTMRQSQNN